MTKLKLTDVEWKSFFFPEIFPEIFIAKSSDSNALKEGEVPFVGRSASNNGFQGLYEVPLNKIVDKNCITVGMVGEPRAFYQPYDFTCSQNILVLRNNELNKNNSKFLISNINNYLISKGYGYGYPVGLNRVIKNKLVLPTDSKGQPNWQFMEDYIKQEQKIQAQRVIDYYERKLIELDGDVVGLDKVEWKTFLFTEIFQEIQRGKRLTKANQTEGDKPYISSTAENNGVDGFIGNDSGVRTFENVLTLANSGSVGSTFYQNFEFVASDHVTALKSEEADKYASLFMSSVVRRLEEKYSFNREINDIRIKREKIILPADENGNPDFQYMSDFVKKLELDKVKEVLEYIYQTD